MTVISVSDGDVNGASKKFDCTIDALTNSAVAKNILLSSIASGLWADHESMFLDVWVQWQTTVATLTLKVKYGANSFTLISALGAGANAITRHTLELHRIGTTIYVLNGAAYAGVANQVHAEKPLNNNTVFDTQYDNSAVGYGGGTMTGVDFTLDQDLVLEAQFNVASPVDTITMLSAIVTKL